MNLPIYSQTKKFVINSFNQAGKPAQIKHLLRTAYWLKKLKPGADEALLVSAVAHDIERAFRQKDMLKKLAESGSTNSKFYRLHEERGAKIIVDFLLKQKVDSDFIKRVEELVSRHEEGGDADQDLLKDADSVSFFENNAAIFIDKAIEENKKKTTKQKFNWMFNRITSKKAKQLAHPLYEKAIRALNARGF
ncbi:MAG: DUF4202 family protein [bacterium]|nr:DUF4202 family protein [bacterium]